LQGEQIAGVAGEPSCPQMRVGFGIDQLGSDAGQFPDCWTLPSST
jgi:hypothetical protein